MNLFGSGTKTGKGKRFELQEQIATAQMAGATLGASKSVVFSGMETEIDIGAIGCGDVPFLCLEFRKGERPKPNYVMIMEGDSLISCKRRDCESGKL